MGWKRWKALEKQVAKLLGGMRRSRVMYSESVEDVIHKDFAIECKYGKQIPKWVQYKGFPITVNKKYVIITMSDLISQIRMNTGVFYTETGVRTKFVDNAINQALGYDSSKKKIPLIAMKPPRYRGVIFCVRLRDFERFKNRIGRQLRMQQYQIGYLAF